MEIASSTNGEALDVQYDERFIGRVYRTTAVVWAVVAAIIGGRYGMPAVMGLAMGAAIAMGSLRLIELAVRHLLCPGMPTKPRHFTLLFFLKLPLLTVVMAGAVWTIMAGYANVFALVGGVAMVHAVIFLKALGNLLVAALPAGRRRGVRRLTPARTLATRRARRERALPHSHTEPAPGAWLLGTGD